MKGFPERGDSVEAWLKACILDFSATDDECSRITLEAMLDDYHLHADTGTFLWEQVEETR